MVFFDIIGVIIGMLFLHSTVQAPAPTENIQVTSPTNTQSTQPAKEAATVVPEVVASSPSVEKLAKCLTKKGVIMYGAYWCPHCANQKKDFGTAFQYIHYQECDDKGAGGDSKLCQKIGIKGYPTWIVPGQNMVEGEQTFATLAKLSNCPFTE